MAARADASVKVAVRVRPYIGDDYYAKQGGKEAMECIVRMDKDLQKTTARQMP